MEEQDTDREIERLNREGGACLERGDLEGALDRFDRCLALLAGAEGTPRGSRAALLNNRAMVLVRLGRFREARDAFLQAAGEHRAAGAPVSAGWLLGNAGSACRDMRAYDEALEHYHAALELFARQGVPAGIADQSGNIGYIHAMKDDPDSAAAWFEKALELYVEQGEERKAELTRVNLQALRSSPRGKP